MKLFGALKKSLTKKRKEAPAAAAEPLEQGEVNSSVCSETDSQQESVFSLPAQPETKPNLRFARPVTDAPVKLFSDKETDEEKLVGVVITIFAEHSYDENFREVRPETVPGEKVSTYSMSLFSVGELHEYLLGTQVPEGIWRQIVEDIRSVPADSVTFNWECCGACSDGGFCNSRPRRSRRSTLPGASPTIHLISFALQSGFSVMCSDFSLKALIAEWSEELLGPNPFLRVRGNCDSQFQLGFFPEHLKDDEVPQQLQVVGELCAKDGKAVVTAMSDTIVYTVNPRRQETDAYQLKVLTVVTQWAGGSMPAAMECEIQEGEARKRGAAGHVALSYPSGGQLITSMGHWIELTRIDTSVESIMQVAAKNFGEHEIRKTRAALSGARTETERMRCLQDLSKEMIQKSIPSKMKGRTKY